MNFLGFPSASAQTIWYRDNHHIAFMICAVYLAIVFGIQAYMRSRERYEVRALQAFWNLCLSAFSFMGAFRMVLHLIATISHKSFKESICDAPNISYGSSGASGLWAFLFIASKIPELGDTIFVVLGKRKLIFLHWYHHVTVLLYTWNAYATRSSAGIWFISMNYSVHAIMYLYYGIMCITSLLMSNAKRIDDKNTRSGRMAPLIVVRSVLARLAPVITTFQVTQMVMGVVVTIGALFYKLTGEEQDCFVTRENLFACFLMYLSYLILFLMFAIERYCGDSTKKKTA